MNNSARNGQNIRVERPCDAQAFGCFPERPKKLFRVISGASTFLPKYEKAYVHAHRQYRLHQLTMLHSAQESAYLFGIFEALYRVVFRAAGIRVSTYVHVQLDRSCAKIERQCDPTHLLLVRVMSCVYSAVPKRHRNGTDVQPTTLMHAHPKATSQRLCVRLHKSYPAEQFHCETKSCHP